MVRPTSIHKFKKPSVSVDIVVFTVIDDDLKVLLIKRLLPPFKGSWALPGGFVRINESLENAARRELQEETGVSSAYLEQLYTFGEIKRDPRGRVITVSYVSLIDRKTVKLKATTDAETAGWFSVSKMPELAFDHKKIIRYGLRRLRYKMEYTAVGFELLPEEFTLTELQKLYSVILNETLDKRNFRKKIFSMDIVEQVGRYKTGYHRPAMLYKFKKKKPESKFKRVKFEG